MTYHILNGDALVGRFIAAELEGEIVVTREALIDGDLDGDTLPGFWQTRAKYIAASFQADEASYYQDVVTEFDKLLAAPDGSEFNLWFGYDLFCRANMWFVLSLLQSLPIKKTVFVVYPSYLAAADIWEDFGSADSEDLKIAFKSRVQFSSAELDLAADLWNSFKKKDFIKLKELSVKNSPGFPYLNEVCTAHIERFPLTGKGRPELVIEEIIRQTGSDFYSVFTEFSKREGVYGFGDLQVKEIYDKILQ